MEDEKSAATPRKRAAKAKPNDTSNPSAAAEQATTGAGRTPRPRKIPPATFVPPVPSAPATPEPNPPAPTQRPADPTETSTPTAEDRPAARKAAGRPAKAAKKAAKKAAPAMRSPQDQAPPTEPVAKKAAAKKAPARKTPAKKAPAKAVDAAQTAKVVEAVQAAEAAPVTEAIPPAASPPSPPPTPTRPAQTPAQAPTGPPASVQRQLWPIIKANPGYATELLALAAVERLGPQAADHLRWLRDTYPGADADGLVRIATARSVRQARTQGAVAGLVGSLAVFAETVALLWIQARLVLDIAAVYGRDPADSDRAAELLTLLRVHEDPAEARQALAAAREAAGDGAGGGNDLPRVTVPLVRVAGRAVVRMGAARQAARIVPGAGAALTAILDGRSTELLAVRAAQFYKD